MITEEITKQVGEKIVEEIDNAVPTIIDKVEEFIEDVAGKIEDFVEEVLGIDEEECKPVVCGNDCEGNCECNNGNCEKPHEVPEIVQEEVSAE